MGARTNPHIQTLIDTYVEQRRFSNQRVRRSVVTSLAQWSQWCIPEDIGHCGALGNLPIRSLDKRICDRRLEDFQRSGGSKRSTLKASTVRWYKNVFRSFLAWCAASGYLPPGSECMCGQGFWVEDKALELRVVDALSDAEYTATILAARACARPLWPMGHAELLARLCGDCGLRVSEAFHLTWGEVLLDCEHPHLALRQTARRGLKTRHALRCVPLGAAVLRLLREVRQRSGCDMPGVDVSVLEAAHGVHWKEQRCNRWESIARSIRRISKVERFTFAILRHTFATRWIRHCGWEAASLEALASVMGHSTSEITKAYYIHKEPVRRIEIPDVLTMHQG